MGGWLFMLGMGVVGFVAQAVDGALGMGYGVFSTSLLVGIGLAPAIASASVHTAETATTLVSGISHWRLGNVRWKLFWRLVVPGVVGGVAGAYSLASIPGKQMKPVVSGLLLVMGGLVLYRFLTHKELGRLSERQMPLWQASLLGLVALLVGGVIAAPLAAWLCKKLPHRALGIAIRGSFVLLNARTLILALL